MEDDAVQESASHEQTRSGLHELFTQTAPCSVRPNKPFLGAHILDRAPVHSRQDRPPHRRPFVEISVLFRAIFGDTQITLCVLEQALIGSSRSTVEPIWFVSTRTLQTAKSNQA